MSAKSTASRSARYRAIASHYRRELSRTPDRLLDALSSSLSPDHRARVLYSFQRTPRTYELDLDSIHPKLINCLLRSVSVTGSADLTFQALEASRQPVGRHWDPIRVHQLRDTTVDPSTGLVFVGDRVVSQSSYGFRSASDGAFLSSATPRVRKSTGTLNIPGPIAPFGGAVYNYYHFLIETLPRILFIKVVEPNVSVTFTQPLPRHVDQILTALGINFLVVPERPFRHDNVYLCDPAPFAWPHPDSIRMLHELDVPSDDPDERFPSKIYVSRVGTSRDLVDQHHLERALEERGFMTVRPENLSWSDQVQLFRNAQTVVAPHGAGLANIVFMSPGSRVYEITTGSWWYPCFRNIAHMGSLDHELIVIPSTLQAPHGAARDAVTQISEALRRD